MNGEWLSMSSISHSFKTTLCNLPWHVFFLKATTNRVSNTLDCCHGCHSQTLCSFVYDPVKERRQRACGLTRHSKKRCSYCIWFYPVLYCCYASASVQPSRLAITTKLSCGLVMFLIWVTNKEKKDKGICHRDWFGVINNPKKSDREAYKIKKNWKIQKLYSESGHSQSKMSPLGHSPHSHTTVSQLWRVVISSVTLRQAFRVQCYILLFSLADSKPRWPIKDKCEQKKFMTEWTMRCKKDIRYTINLNGM